MNGNIKNFLGNKDHLGRRYLIFLIGVFICAFGISLTIKSNLGTSPVSSIPYTLSLLIPGVSLGTWFIFYSFGQIIAEIIMLKKRCTISDLIIQVVLALLLGYITDFFLFLMSSINTDMYIVKMLFLIVGCALLAFGVYLELVGDVGMYANDAFIKALSIVSKKEYGTVKIIADISMIVVSAAIGFIFLGRLTGVREGSIIAAVIIGLFIKLYKKIFGRYERRWIEGSKD